MAYGGHEGSFSGTAKIVKRRVQFIVQRWNYDLLNLNRNCLRTLGPLFLEGHRIEHFRSLK